MAQRYLTSVVPFAGDVDISDVLKLREREPEAFILYRQALTKAIREVRDKKGTFRERDAQQLYSDVIEPNLARLDAGIVAAKRGLRKSVRRNILGWTAALSFGVYAGFVSKDLAAIAGALGLTKVIADLANLAMTKSDGEEAIRSEEMYFLWKMRKSAHS